MIRIVVLSVSQYSAHIDVPRTDLSIGVSQKNLVVLRGLFPHLAEIESTCRR